MSRKVLKKGFLDEEEAQQKEIQRNYTSGVVPWSSPNGLQATDRIVSTTQGPGTSGTRRKVSSARYQDTSPGAEALSSLGRHHPMFTEETRPGAVVVHGIDDDGLTIEEAYDEQATLATHEEESTVNVIARAVDTEEERRMRHDLDQVLQMLNNAPILTRVIATNRDKENQNANIHANHDDLPSSDHSKCGSKGRQWFAMSAAILLIVVAIAVTLALVLQPEPTLPGPTTLVPNTQEPTTIAPTAQPPPSQDLIDLLSSASSDRGVALADPLTPQNRALTWLAGDPNLESYTDQQKIQRYALATLYYATNGDNWNRNDDWLSYEDVCDKWYQNLDTTIDCTADGISSLDLSKNNLQAVIPPEISMLSNSLERLGLYENSLTGSIPTEIGELTKLTYLSLWVNSLTGTIPNELGLLTKLTFLDLGSNRFTGTAPTSLASLTLLAHLSLWNNALTGTIPNELELLAKLNYLDLGQDGFTGTVPASLASLTHLTVLSLWDNSLIGTIPNELGLLTKLTLLHLSSNYLTGTVPTSLASLTLLTYLSLWVNSLTGAIPSELGLLTELTFLDLGSNRFNGIVPTSLASLTHLAFLSLWKNSLSGIIRNELGLLTKLTYLDLGWNGFTGLVPTSLASLTLLTLLSLRNNGLYGTISNELGLLMKLTLLDLSSNDFTGTVPTSLASLPLLWLFLDGNDLTGSLDAFCGIDFEMFAANTCGEEEIDCQCCTHCCKNDADCYPV